MMSAIASIIDEKESEEIKKVVEDITDPAGLFIVLVCLLH